MGRRPGSTKKNQGNQMIDLSVKDQLESENPSSKRINVSTEVTAELTNVALLEKETLENVISPRRSQRINNAAPAPSSQHRDIQAVVENIEPVIENIEGSESGEEDQQCFGEKNNKPESTEEKIDRLFQLIEEQRKTIKALGADKSCPSQNLSQAEIRLEMKINKYKNMYVDSQKKIKDLEEENYDLMKKLECAHAKLEGYEKGQHVFSEVMEKLKDVFFLSSLTKTTDTVLGISSPRPIAAGQAPPNLSSEAKTQAAKRKKGDKGEASSQAGKRMKDANGNGK
ncbi:hypothetical protein BVC80_441g266 [Macleaya cordata]|uniref:Uncharacterized protein n=1 Tax=Macleaya cordata TaxID=56857 RepID=A0A200Q4T0_MACCD|nr:hypothetical protein BVC80_441g266 [Macleaya cordata]